MFWKNLKKKLSALIDPFWPKCPSGLGHRVVGKVSDFDGNKYCCHSDCSKASTQAVMRHFARQYDTSLAINHGDRSYFVHGDNNGIRVLKLKLLELERLRREVGQYEHNYNKAYSQGLQSGNQMDLQILIDTLLEVRLQLLEKAAQFGILEPRIHPYIKWFEEVRDNRMAAPSDMATYKVCKAIAKLEGQIILAQQELTKKKNETNPAT